MYRVKNIYKPFLFLIDLVGYILFFWVKFKKFDEKKIKRILIIRLDHIGDVLLTIPTFRALRNKFPNAKMDVLVRPFTKELLIGNKDINKIIALNPPWFAREKTNISNLFGFIKNNYRKYNLVIELHADPRNIILASLIGKYRIGFGIRGFGFLLNKVVHYDKKIKHQIERNLDVVRAIGADTKNKELELNLSKKELNFANEMFKKYNIKEAVCINPGTGRIHKYWFNDRWAEVADELIKKYNFNIILTGNKNDIKDCKEIHNLSKNKEKIINLCGKTNLRQLVAIIKKCKLFLGPDTGPMHIARAVKTPLVGLFGPVDPREWGYDEDEYKSLNKTICLKSGIINCECMKRITVEDVLKEVKKIV